MLSLSHLIIILLIVIILFGNNKITKIMEDLGKGIKAFKKELKDDEESK